ncbi:MAG: hypothetical protein M1819_005541 [Sarea resinae]|nr:MAG: hypothetical protein M1819_005541 [Sarea resinae]
MTDRRRASTSPHAHRSGFERSASTTSYRTPESVSTSARSRAPASGRDVTPSSSLLHDLLREKKAQSHRVTKSYSQNKRRSVGRDDAIFALESNDLSAASRRLAQSSPVMPAHRGEGASRQGRRSSVVGSGGKGAAGPRGMGAREMDGYISTLHKQNFDLKLELFHRRQRMAQLEEQLEKAEILEEENAELLDVNEQLLQELEKRDQAIKEAVAIICNLEEQVERIEEGLNKSDPLTEPAEPGDSDGEDAPPSSPPEFEKLAPKTPPRVAMLKKTPSKIGLAPGVSDRLIDLATPGNPQTPMRIPSFLSSQKSGSGSAGALRSLYLAGEDESKSQFSFVTMSKRAGLLGSEVGDALPNMAPDADELSSPRLSVLSESSFLSVYGQGKGHEHRDDDNPSDLEEVEETEKRDDSSKRRKAARIEKWIDEGDTPSKPSRAVRADGGNKDRYLAIRSVLQNRPHLSEDRHGSRRSPQREPPQMRREDKKSAESLAPSLGGPIFGQDLLPPTPDTMSTGGRTLNRSTSSIVGEKSLLDGTPAPVKSYSALRPHSSGGDVRASIDSTRTFGTDFEFNDQATSDGELESMRVEQSEFAYGDDQFDSPGFPMMAGASARAFRMLSGTPTKSPFEPYGGNLMFNGEGIDKVPPSRSTPPLPPMRRRSMDFPHAADPRARLQRTDTAMSQPDWRSGSSNTATPSHNRYNSDASSLTAVPPSAGPLRSQTQTPLSASRVAPGTPQSSEHRLQRSSLRLRVPGMTKSPSPSKRASLTSRLFGRVTHAGQQQQQQHSSPATEIHCPPSATSEPRPRSLRTNSSANTSGDSLRGQHQNYYQQQPHYQAGARPGTAGSVEGKSHGRVLALRERAGSHAEYLPWDDAKSFSTTSASMSASVSTSEAPYTPTTTEHSGSFGDNVGGGGGGGGSGGGEQPLPPERPGHERSHSQITVRGMLGRSSSLKGAVKK